MNVECVIFPSLLLDRCFSLLLHSTQPSLTRLETNNNLNTREMLCQPQLVPVTPTSYTGYLTLSTGTEYFISLDHSTSPPSFTPDTQLQSALQPLQSRLQTLLNESKNKEWFVGELVALLEKHTPPPPPSPCHDQILSVIRQIADLPSESVKRVDINSVTLQVRDDADRYHVIILNFPGPVISCDLPIQPHPSTSCRDILDQVSSIVEQHQSLWDTLDEIDSKCWVVEPEKGSRKHSYRRIVVTPDVSIIVNLDPQQPTSLPRCRFLGSPSAIGEYQDRLDEFSEDWDSGMGVVDNLGSILDVALPSGPTGGEESRSECGVCYCHEMEGKTPEISCNSSSCKQLFHLDCLLEWFRGLSNVRQSFGTVFGECPYCSKSMHVQALL